MAIESLGTVAVINLNNYSVAAIPTALGFNHSAGISGINRFAVTAGNINARVAQAEILSDPAAGLGPEH